MKYFIVAGNLAQARALVTQMGFDHSNTNIVSNSEQLMGLSNYNLMVLLYGTWAERSDARQIMLRITTQRLNHVAVTDKVF